MKILARAILLLMILGCQSCNNPRTHEDSLRIVTTTSTRDSGLMKRLVPAFRQLHNCEIEVIAVGSGAALRMGESGDADVLVTHAPQAEKQFMDAGYGERQLTFMENHFLLLGPAPIDVGFDGLDAPAALLKLAQASHSFFSRGDNSGTHQRELLLWQQAGGRPAWEQYQETGQGMGATLTIANEQQGYVLVDIGTYLNFRAKIDLVPLPLDAAKLRNSDTVTIPAYERHPYLNKRLACAFVDFLGSEDAAKIIAGHRIGGEQLFWPIQREETTRTTNRTSLQSTPE